MPKTVEHFKKYAAGFYPKMFPDEFLFYTERGGRRFTMSPDNTERFIKNMAFLHIVSIKKFQNHYTPIYSAIVAAYIYTEVEC